MAQLTRLQARTLIQQLIDDPAAALWSAPNLDILAEGALDELWGELLDSFPWLRSTESAVLTPVAPGTVNLDTALTRFYRLQIVARDGSAYVEADPKDVLVVNSEQIVARSQTYAVMGSLLYLFPLSTTANVYVRYMSRPTAYTSLASDSTVVDWPDGYHMAYVYDIAARALEKGDREKSDTFRARATDSLFRLKAYLRKRGLGAVMPYTSDDALSWGGA